MLNRLLGNEQLKARLRAMLRTDRLSHSFLLTGADGSGKHTLAVLLAAAMQCTAAEKPCGICTQCRKVLDGQHPDVITVDDTEHKNLPVALIRDMCADLYIRPNEGNRKIYVFPRAADMNAAGQNALLKVTEEPPSYGAYLLLAADAQQLLPTIRSRCVVLTLAPLSRTVLLQALAARFPDSPAAAREAAYLRSGGYLGQAIRILDGTDALLPQTVAFAQAYGTKDPLALTRVLVPMERLKREILLPVLQQWISLLQDALSLRAGMPAATDCSQISANHTAGELFHAIRCLQQAVELCNANTNIGILCGALQVQLTQTEQEILWTN